MTCVCLTTHIYIRRPGHYDILDNKSSLPGEQLHMSAIPSISITRSGSSEAGQSTVSGSVGAATW